MKAEAESLRSELSALLEKTPKAAKIDTIQKAQAFKALHEKATKAAKGRNIEALQSLLAELSNFHR